MFELKPDTRTLEHMHSQFEFNPTLQTFGIDQEIESAYQSLKPIFDSLHEEFITERLESEWVSKISFSEYLIKYCDREKLGEEVLKKDENVLRSEFGKVFEETLKIWKERAGLDEIAKEASTAVAKRIVHDNLPKFCDNILFFN